MSGEFQTIEIDFDIHKLIETNRRGFSEPPYIALRRLLNIDKAGATPPAPGNGIGRAWSGKGVVLPHGALVRMDYNGRSHSGEIVDGQWHVEGGIYGSPSAAAVGVAKNKSGGSINSLDGWLYWHAKMPGSAKWESMKTLRHKVAA